MQKRKAILSTLLTFILCMFGIAGDVIFGSKNRAWGSIEYILNLPATAVQLLVGSGHGVPQLVFPFVFSVAFYVVVFWFMISILEHFWARFRS